MKPWSLALCTSPFVLVQPCGKSTFRHRDPDAPSQVQDTDPGYWSPALRIGLKLTLQLGTDESSPRYFRVYRASRSKPC
ncbi:hypothetical protein BO78DRAFT_399422 [Aspergillus sclerotiicarbonarius CBS 121057]|uniref:Uncharacterized protein n=1 Tax=Aspergillus sclerotiicarbonarius (strain CBS 121057 / IBT 28362) TaxID=1448318 RepID=A0A319E1H2_ASPSB|nr:hypothetical protein BO78DRAFT_399422 [Aspergillus sclerotiicarbonarius CBS 121057]